MEIVVSVLLIGGFCINWLGALSVSSAQCGVLAVIGWLLCSTERRHCSASGGVRGAGLGRRWDYCRRRP